MTMRWANCMFFVFFLPSPLSTYKMQLGISSTSQNYALQSQQQIAKQFIYNHYLLEEEQAKKHPRWGSIEHSLVMVPKHKKLSKGDWCPVRQNMANGSAPIALNLGIPTASALQD